jgi:hypothetical protein
MKKYVKARVVAKNNPQGSYAAGCGAHSAGHYWNCHACERSR